MKRASSRQPIEKLYILGAGSSYALSEIKSRGDKKFAASSTPLDKDFLSRLVEFTPKNRGWQKRALDLIRDDWLDHRDLTKHGLEEAIIKRVGQYEMLVSLHQQKTRGKVNNPVYVNHLTHLITDYLLTCKSNNSGATKKFIDETFPKHTEAKDYRNRIITFNYDTIIERPLLERNLSKKKIYFDRISSKPNTSRRRNADEVFPHPLILKLHGSANWRCTKADFESIISGEIGSETKIDIWTDDKPCPNPNDEISPLIIPPIPNKPITGAKIFLDLWTTAYEYLHEAKEVIIIGYSCPTTDTLARTMFTHFEPNKLKRIVIADPDTNALSRYRSLMIPKVASSAKWEYFSNFSEFIQHEFK
ncbi:MAG: hypothetical protein RLZZ151_31 [Pseudomonadota bacterium]|jgi:hypothetical protein